MLFFTISNMGTVNQPLGDPLPLCGVVEHWQLGVWSQNWGVLGGFKISLSVVRLINLQCRIAYTSADVRQIDTNRLRRWSYAYITSHHLRSTPARWYRWMRVLFSDRFWSSSFLHRLFQVGYDITLSHTAYSSTLNWQRYQGIALTGTLKYTLKMSCT